MNVDRRTLLIGGGAGVGLVVAYLAWPRHLGSDLATKKNEQAFGNFIKIARDGRITIAVPQSETGQGIWTGLPQIVADELGAAWDSIGVEPAPLTSAYANALAGEEGWLDGFGWLRAYRVADDGRMRITANSTSVRSFEQPLRKAAAIARTMLVGAAADRWTVNAGDCDTGDGFVMNRGRTFTFGELAEEAADRTPPLTTTPKQTSEGRLIGKPLPRLDGPSKSDGSWRFAADVRLDDMLFASVRMAPPGGVLTGFDRQAIESVHGIRHVASRADWFAVLGATWWAAERGVVAANPRFRGPRDPADVRGLFEDALSKSSERQSYRRGDYEGTIQGSRPLAATYFVNPSQHLGLETLSATARFTGNRLEIWAPTQAPGLTRDAAALAARIPSSDVTLYPMPVGEPAGRAMESDAVSHAIELAKELRRPVQVTLSQSSNQNHDLLSSGALGRMMALPGEGGITAAWKMEVASTGGMGSVLRRMLDIDDKKELIRTLADALPPYAIPNVTLEAVRPKLPYRTGYMRGSPFREFAFFTESFADELAHAAGLEPLSYRMSLLGGNGRLARCLQGAARLASWDGGAPGSTMGIAGCSAFGSHIGLVANARLGPGGQVRVDRLVAAVDCGSAVNPSLVEQQVEAGLVWALAQAIVPKPEWAAAMPRGRPMGEMGLPRLSDAPQITIELIPSSDSPGGVSGLGTSVLAPAVANAIFAASGKRMRELPFDPMR